MAVVKERGVFVVIGQEIMAGDVCLTAGIPSKKASAVLTLAVGVWC